MFQQAELDNYKLQVELLQKKLERSEEQRQHLEDKYEKIQKKRNEHEKSMKAKSRIKFEEFLEEQRERNERNKTIVKMLENIDQQASTLATRTERLKIMKLQYELYFAKLLQSHAMRSLQNSPRYSILPINQLQAQQSVVYPTIPVQSGGIQTIPINPTLQSTNIYQNPENFQQQRIPTMTINNNPVNLPNTGSDNWNTILMGNPNINPNQMTPITANYMQHPGNELIYRYPNQIDYYNAGQMLLNQNALNQLQTPVAIGPNQLGLPIRSGTVPLMSPSDFHDSLNNPILSLHHNNNNYPNQIQQQQRKPNKYSTKNNISEGRHNNDRDELQNNEDCKFYDQNTPMSDRDQLKLNQFRKLQENIKSNDKPSMQPQITKNKNQFNLGKPQNDSDRDDDDNDEPYKNNPDIFYRKDPISSKQSTDQLPNGIKSINGESSSIIENFPDNLESSDGKVMTDVNVKTVEKSQPMNLPIRISDGPKQKLNENILNLSELQQPELRSYQSFDRRKSISSQLEKSKEPVGWNFNGLNNTKLSSQSDQFAKKEKISIENIENAIYGELINPERQMKNFIPVETIRNQVRPEPLNFKEIIERENYQEEKTDSSSEKPVITDSSISANKLDLGSPKNQIISNQSLNKIDKDANLFNETMNTPQNLQNTYNTLINITQSQPNISNEMPNTPQKEPIISNEPPIILQNQKVSEEYEQNYENQYFTEPTTNIQNTNITTNDSTYDNYNNYQQEPESTAEYPPTENNNVQNYETDLTQSFGQQPVDVQENLERTVTPTVQNQDGYENQQYDPNYQYQADQNYPQQEYTEQNQQQNPDGYTDNYIQNVNTEYQNYPNQEYQGAYDPNTYDYNYDQQQNYQDPNQQYIPEEYNQNYQPVAESENYQNYDQQQTGDIIDQTEIVPATENYIQPTEPLAQIPIVDNSELNQPLQPSVPNISESKNVEDVIEPNPVPTPPVKVNVKPILSKEKSVDLDSKKKKKVNFVDSSETESSSSVQKQDTVPTNNDESDFDFSSTN